MAAALAVPQELPSAPHRLGRSVNKAMVSVAPLRWAATRLGRLVVDAPQGSRVRRMLGPLHARVGAETTAAELLLIVDTIRSAGVETWLAGGWGVDALVGRQTRRHADVDLVVDDFERSAPLAAAALASLGFETVLRYRAEALMPDCWQMRYRSLRSVGFTSLDWPRLCAALDRDGPALGGRGDPSAPQHVLAEGLVAGRPVPCLSAKVQVLLHSDFELTGDQRQDLARLRSLVGNGG